MLIELSVANFRSIREQQTFSLVKGVSDELEASNSFQVGRAEEFRLLRSAVVYGANAAGKSNFILALSQMKDIVLLSAQELQHGDRLPVTPFMLDEFTRFAPTEFEVMFLVEGVRYQYGFSCDDARIHSEWLLAYPKGRAQTWFSRTWDAVNQSYYWTFSNFFVGEKYLWQRSTRDNALFLSTAVQLNSEQLKPVFDWFKNRLHAASSHGWDAGFTASLCEGDQKARVLDFLRAADVDIADVEVEKKRVDTGAFGDDVPDSIKQDLAQRLKGQSYWKIRTRHQTPEGSTATFNFSDESQGTQKLFAAAGPWIDSLSHGNVLFIDELNNSLHPKLVLFLVQLFHSSETNPHSAQLVFTTHETSILSQDVFRRDQIWFCEKDDGQATSLFPLTDFRPRKGRENLEQAYLSGRYSALPNVGKPTIGLAKGQN